MAGLVVLDVDWGLDGGIWVPALVVFNGGIWLVIFGLSGSGEVSGSGVLSGVWVAALVFHDVSG